MKNLLLIIEGHDRTGKDTLVSKIKEEFGDSVYYLANRSNDDKEEYRATSFEDYLYHYIDNQVKQLLELKEKYKVIIVPRMYISDNVYADMFGRKHITENFMPQLTEYFDIKNYIILWNTFDEYIKRLNLLGVPTDEYNEYEFYQAKSLFLKYSHNETDTVLIIDNQMSKDLIYENFSANIIKDIKNELE